MNLLYFLKKRFLIKCLIPKFESLVLDLYFQFQKNPIPIHLAFSKLSWIYNSKRREIGFLRDLDFSSSLFIRVYLEDKYSKKLKKRKKKRKN